MRQRWYAVLGSLLVLTLYFQNALILFPRPNVLVFKVARGLSTRVFATLRWASTIAVIAPTTARRFVMSGTSAMNLRLTGTKTRARNFCRRIVAAVMHGKIKTCWEWNQRATRAAAISPQNALVCHFITFVSVVASNYIFF